LAFLICQAAQQRVFGPPREPALLMLRPPGIPFGLLLLLCEQHGGEPSPVRDRQVEQRRGERRQRVGLLGFRLAGASRGASARRG
jgi:hypothetical protein